MSGTIRPLETVSKDDHGAQVVIVDYMFLILSAIVVLARGITRYRISGIVSANDLVTLSAMVLAVGQSICVQLAVTHGLGRRQDTLSAAEFQLYSKFNYASQILFVAVLTFAKISVAQLIEAIKPQRPVLLACRGLMIVIVTWAVTSILALSFQCSLPDPWDFASGRCINQAGLYYYIGVMNILTDVAIVILPVPMMWPVQVATSKKVLVVGLFSTRIMVVAMVIVQLVFLQHYLDDRDKTWANVPLSLLTQIVMNLSIVTACIPSLRRVMADLQTGLTALTITDNLELSLGGKVAYASGTKLSNAGARTNVSTVFSNLSDKDDEVVPYGHNVGKRVRHITSVVSGGNNQNKEHHSFAGWKSSSQEHLRDEITRTVEFKVEYEREQEPEQEQNRSETDHSL